MCALVNIRIIFEPRSPRIRLILALNVTLWELHCAVTALPRSRTVTVEC